MKEMAKCLLEERYLAPYLWDEAVNCASYIHNRVPHKSMIGATPFKALMGHNPNVSHLRVFVSKAWARIPTDKRKAFQAQSRKYILLGYVDDENAYKPMDVGTKKCFIKRSVQFE